MVELFEQQERTFDRQSSKGNQLKWSDGSLWYKADYTGYEGFAEYMVSHIMQYSNLQKEDFILYQTEEIHYKKSIYLGCESENFLPQNWQLITLERLFKLTYGESLHRSIFQIANEEERLKFLVEQTERITGLKDFGIYMSKMLTLDAFFLNEDRHTHNIAVLMDLEGNYAYCPYFDNGATLLSDTAMDYPMGEDVVDLIGGVKAKTFSVSFDEQLDIAERLYGQHVTFRFTAKDVDKLLEQEKNYSLEIKQRVKEILYQQMRKYKYLFQSKGGI